MNPITALPSSSPVQVEFVDQKGNRRFFMVRERFFRHVATADSSGAIHETLQQWKGTKGTKWKRCKEVKK